jgi:hypothetical protein
MPSFRIHRMRETPRQQFRWAPHTCGITSLKPRDYEAAGDVDASGFYAAWMSLRGSGRALDIGDVLESETGELRICKYVGFEEARWVLPEIRSGLETAPVAAGPPQPDSAAQPA